MNSRKKSRVLGFNGAFYLRSSCTTVNLNLTATSRKTASQTASDFPSSFEGRNSSHKPAEESLHKMKQK